MGAKENPACCCLGPFTARPIVRRTVIGSGVFQKSRLVARNVPGFDFVAYGVDLIGLWRLLGALVPPRGSPRCSFRGRGNYLFLLREVTVGSPLLWGWGGFGFIRFSLEFFAGRRSSIFIESLHDIL